MAIRTRARKCGEVGRRCWAHWQSAASAADGLLTYSKGRGNGRTQRFLKVLLRHAHPGLDGKAPHSSGQCGQVKALNVIDHVPPHAGHTDLRRLCRTLSQFQVQPAGNEQGARKCTGAFPYFELQGVMPAATFGARAGFAVPAAGRVPVDGAGVWPLSGILTPDQLGSLRARVDELLKAEGDEAGTEFRQEAGTERLSDLVRLPVLPT